MAAAEKKFVVTLFTAALFSFIIFVYIISSLRYYNTIETAPEFSSSSVRYGPHYPPSFGYYISGGKGQKDRVLRLLLAVYHPRNRYLLHLGSDASGDERSELALAVKSVGVIRAFGNVDVVGKADPITYMGSSNIAAILHAAAILLKLDATWDWFITLSAFDYPLLTQDDLSHAFSSVPRDLNFIDHTSDLGWKEDQRVRPIVVDPGIYLARDRNQIFHATQKRPTPEAFKFFTGSPWVILSRSFLEYCILGWDNMPRTLLMYFTNVMLSQEGYFHSVICNSPEFRNTTMNSDLRYMVWDNPPKMEPRYLGVGDYEKMVVSGAAFARQFEKDESVLSVIDKKILKRSTSRVTQGAWCTGQRSLWMDPCSKWGDVNILNPGVQAKRFKESIMNLLNDPDKESNQCI